jgi:autotransporter passenger strand-loop-strand repeat protein
MTTSNVTGTTTVGSSTTTQYIVTSGGKLIVATGGIVSGAQVQTSGSLVVSGGTDSGAVVSAGGTETVSNGSAAGDLIFGTLANVSGVAGVLTNEVIENGGKFTETNSAVVTGAEVLNGGSMFISGNTSGTNSNTVLSGGGFLELESAKATIGGSLTFEGGNNILEVSATVSSGYGDQAVISGFSTTDKIDARTTALSTPAFTTSGGNTVVTVGGFESFIFSGTTTYTSATISAVSDGSGGEYLEYVPASGVSTSVTVSSGQTSTGLTVSAGETLTVLSGGSISATHIQSSGQAVVSGTDVSATVSAGGTLTDSGSATGDVVYGTVNVAGADSLETVENGGSLTVNSGGVDSGTTILAGGNELVIGSATGDQIYGTQLVSNGTAVVTSETVFAGGALDNFLKGGIASGTVVSSGGALNVNGAAFASNTVLSGGGMLSLQSPKAEATGILVFAGGGNTLDITGTTSAGYGDLALNMGFSATDKIDITSSAFTGSALTLSQTTSGGNTVADVVSGGVTVEAFTFSGTALNGGLSLETDGNGGVFLEETPLPVTTSVTTSTGSGAYTETAGNTLLVLSGGSVSAPTIDAGGFLVVSGGSDSSAAVASGGLETVSAGNASDDNIFGSAVVAGGLVVNETIRRGGAITIDGGVASNTVLDGGATADLATSTAALSGSIDFSGGGNTLEAGAVASLGYGDQATISGFSTSDKIDVASISSSGASLSFAPGAGGTEVATVSGTGGSESFIFANASTYNASTMALAPDGAGVDLVLKTTPVVAFTSLSGLSTNDATQIVNGTVNVSTDPEAAGTTVTVDEGGSAIGTGVVGSNGYWSATVTLTNDDGANTLSASDTDKAGQTGTTSQPLTYNVDTAAAAFTPGDLVVSLSGDSDGSGSYGDNQASPLTLDQLTTSGALVSQLVLPQTTTVVNGVTEYAISDEYGSSSEGTLELSADGHSLVIAGYGINADTFNAGGAAVYGNAALAQSTSVPGGPYTVVPRVIADINADGAVDTSTALTDVYNTNNPRSVATVDGSAFWISGQGVKGDTTQGVFYATDGASTATAIDTATDTRTVEIYNGQLYVSADSTQGAINISDYGALPTSAATPAVLPGINTTVTLTATNGNSVNSSDIGASVYLSPENYFFANDDTLYVADGGDPKNGGLGDGGLQKWEFNGTSWNLEYTLSSGLNLVADTNTDGSSGLIGLAGKVVGGNVELFATNATLSDLDPTYVYAITDSLSSTTGSGETFSQIMAASSGENIRGISFAPTAASVPCYLRGTRILTRRGEIEVEHLEAGDLAITASGETRPVTWIGHRELDCASHPRPETVWPIRVAAGAIAPGMPARDLLISPGHGLFFEDALVPAELLLNGTTIVQERVETVSYWHVELDRHDVLIADGMAAESFLDVDNRNVFANSGAVTVLHPELGAKERENAIWAERGCAPRCIDGPRLAQLRVWLGARAEFLGARTTDDPEPRLSADGLVIAPASRNDGVLHFELPEGVRRVRLLSRSHVPAHDHRRDIRDFRRLGISVSELTIDGVALSPADARLTDGWHDVEADGSRLWRWTNGDAALPAGRAVTLRFHPLASYPLPWRDERQGRRVGARARVGS